MTYLVASSNEVRTEHVDVILHPTNRWMEEI